MNLHLKCGPCWFVEAIKPRGTALVLVILYALGAAMTGMAFAARQAFDPATPAPQQRSSEAPQADKLPPVQSPTMRLDALGDPLPAHALLRLGSARLRHGDPVNAVAYSPDGMILASAGTDHSVRLWDATTGRALGTLANPDAVANPYDPARCLYCLAFSPDGQIIAVGEPTAIRLWDPATAKVRLTLPSHGGTRKLVFSSDGKSLASTGDDGVIRLWDAAAGKPMQAFNPGGGAGHGVCFTADRKGVIGLTADGVVRCWDLKSGTETWRLEGQSDHAGTLALSPDGKTIAVAGLDHAVGLYDTAGKQIRRLRAFTANVQLVTFSPDGKCLAATTPDRVIHLCDPRTGKKVRELRGAQAEIRCLAFAPDGKTLATASGQEPVRRWETATGQEIAPPGGHQGWVGYLEYTSDQKHLVTAGWDWTIRVWERATGKQIFSHPALQVQGRTASLSPDGKLLALAREDGSLSVVDVLTGKEQRRLSGHTVGKVPEGRPRSVDTASRAFYGPVVTLAFAPDGKTLASGGADNLVRIWDLTAGKEIHALAHDRPLWKLTYSPDGKLLASGTRERTVRIWDPATARELRQLEHPLPIECFAFSPDGAILAAGGHDGMVAIWDAREGVLRHRLGTNRGFVMTLAFSPDGRTLAVGNWRNLRLWELASGKERATVPAHWGDVTAVAFAADGRSLATASGDSTAIIWDLTGREVGAGPATLAPAELQKLWQRLASADATDADRALWDLTSAPAQAVPFLKQQLVAWRAQAGHPRLARLIHDLDDDDFGVREKATRELAHLGPVAEPALRKVLEGKPSAEVERRVKGLLTSLQSGKSSDVLRATRSLEVLERIGTPEAKTVLQALSEDTDDVASQAKVSLERLDKRTR